MNRKQSLIDISILLKIYLKAADSNNANRDCSLAHCGQIRPVNVSDCRPSKGQKLTFKIIKVNWVRSASRKRNGGGG